MVIARYISKEIITTFVTIVFTLLFIAISNKFVTFLSKVASGKLPLSLLFKIVGLYIPELFAILAPVAMFVATLFTFSRLHADSEIAVLLTSGFDWRRLVTITLQIAAVIAIMVYAIIFFVVPASSALRAKLLSEGQAAGVINSIVPGRFQTIDESSQLVFYVENVLQDGLLHNIFIALQKKGEVITAKYAQIKQTNQQEFYLVLQNGQRYIGTPGQSDYSITNFAEYGRELKYSAGTIAQNDNMRPAKTLFKSVDPRDRAELQWRFALPVAVLLLTLIAIPLAKVQPRQGRYAKFLPAVIIYMIYYNMMTVIRRSIAASKLAPFPGIWGVHLVFLLLGLFLLMQLAGRVAELKYRIKKI